MPQPRYLAPWHQPDLIEAWKKLERRALAADASRAGAGAGSRSGADAAALSGPELDAAALAALRGKPAIYHCISRVVDRQFVLGPPEKEQFVRYMRAYELFGEVRVLAFSVMSNHFHILLEVPAPPPERGRDWSDAQFLNHLSLLYSERELGRIRWDLEHFREIGNDAAALALRDRFLRRLWDLSSFMKSLKQRFTRWFNRQHARKGTLWEERFKSVLVESGHAARVMAAYIDLNAVRAGIVEDPGDYRWCSYGEAMAGRQRAREGLQRVMCESACAAQGEGPDPDSPLHPEAVAALQSWKVAAQHYRQALVGALERRGGPERPGGKVRVSEGEALGHRVRHFVDGMVIGSTGFVDRAFRWTRDRFGPQRRDGARRIRGVATELRSMRDLSFGDA